VNLCLREFQRLLKSYLGKGLAVTLPWHLGIMVTWSPGDVDIGIQSLLVQIYPILLSTLLSINRQQLSTSDASFALVLSSSPLTIYLVFASICDLFGIHTGLYKRIKTYPLIIRTLGALVLLLWTTLSMVSGLSPSAFKDSSCYTLSFGGWLEADHFGASYSHSFILEAWVLLWGPRLH
jgi:ribose/xylose/arabinose/galactoside ABC-type transport system permease subunit